MECIFSLVRPGECSNSSGRVMKGNGYLNFYYHSFGLWTPRLLTDLPIAVIAFHKQCAKQDENIPTALTSLFLIYCSSLPLSMAIAPHDAQADYANARHGVDQYTTSSVSHGGLGARVVLLWNYIVPSFSPKDAAKDELLPTFRKTSEKTTLYDIGEFTPNAYIPPLLWSSARKQDGIRLAAAIMLAFLCAILILTSGTPLCHGAPPGHSVLSGISSPIQRLWGPYSPYYSAEPYTPPPENCHITQVNIIQRHGARVPTTGASANIITAVNKLQGASEYGTADLTFLSNYTYTLATNGNLLPFGATQSEESGYEAYKRYSSIVSDVNIPFVRSSSGVRVVESATNWTSGFFLASGSRYDLPLSVIISESGNNTLDDNLCPNEGSSDSQTATWASVYGSPIAARINVNAPGANLTADDIPPLMSLCAFESIAYDTPSPFCSLFTLQEYHQYEYFADLGKYYGTGPGAYLGRVQGVGYINELIARLTGTPVRDNTQTNRTLDASPETFPLNRTFYADFSHDNQMVAIYAALGLFTQSEHLDPKHPDEQRTWIASRLTPFSARMVTERLTCTQTDDPSSEDTYVRILVNDALQPLSFCGANSDGLCTLNDFVKSQVYSREDGQGDFEKCYA